MGVHADGVGRVWNTAIEMCRQSTDSTSKCTETSEMTVNYMVLYNYADGVGHRETMPMDMCRHLSANSLLRT